MTKKRIVTFSNLYLLILLSTFLIGGCTSCPEPFECAKGTLVEVPAKPKDWSVDVFTPTTIKVKNGDTISFLASGTWDMGAGSVGPAGTEATCECVVSEKSGADLKGRLGALVGRIGEKGKGTPFLIGCKKSITATQNGTLFLTSNDNLGRCDNISSGSCYYDNTGSIKVCVDIK